MDNSNIIISIIIVLCIAAGVTAYGISEGDNAVFNDLTGFTLDSSSSGSNGIGDLVGNDSNQGTGSDVSTGTTQAPSNGGSSNSGSSNGGSGTGSSSGTGTGTNTGSSSNGGGSGNGGTSNQTQTTNKISSQEAQNIASTYIGEPGAYVSSVKDDGTMYICYISNSTGSVVDAIGISYTGENIGKV